MHSVRVSKVYGKRVNSKCEACKSVINSDETCYHCPRSRNLKCHRIAFDYCTRCVQGGYTVDNPPPYQSDGTMFLSDRDFSIIIAYWFRTLIVDVGACNMMNVPLTVIEHHIIPYIYAKKTFQYNVSVGLFELSNGTKCEQFMENLTRNISDTRNASGHCQWNLLYKNWEYDQWSVRAEGGIVVTYKGCKIGKYAVDIDFHSIPVDRNGYMTVRSVSTILDLSIAVVLCGDSKYDSEMVKKVVSKSLRHSEHIHVLYLHFGTNYESIDALEKELKTEWGHKVKGMDERLKRYGAKSRWIVDHWKDKVKVIDVQTPDDKDSVVSLLTMLNHAITAYIQRLDSLYKAV